MNTRQEEEVDQVQLIKSRIQWLLKTMADNRDNVPLEVLDPSNGGVCLIQKGEISQAESISEAELQNFILEELSPPQNRICKAYDKSN